VRQSGARPRTGWRAAWREAWGAAWREQWRDDWRRRAAWVVGGFIAALLVGIAYGFWLQRGGDWAAGLPWERRVMLRLHTTLPDAVDRVMLVLPWFGTNITLAPLVAVAAVWLVVARRRADLALHLLVVQAGSWILNPLIKALFDRPRPDLWPQRGQHAFSAYPSGHAIASISVLVTVAVLLYRERGWRWPLVAVATLVVVSLYSRLYLGVHWPTDVAAGILIGLVWLFATLRAFPAPRARVRRVRQV
jgi:undecaprenyl-diphosphatase